MSKLRLAKKLIEDGKKYRYVNIGKRRIYNNVVKLSKLIKGGEELLDIGGHPHLGHGYSFEEYITMVCDINYEWVGRSKLDMRTDELPYETDSFDVVVSWETIEHLWLIEKGGMLDWEGIFNFWREAYRVLKPGGTFYVSTRNRVCLLALNHIFKNDPVQVAPSTLHREGHVREFSPSDFRDIALYTNHFKKNTICSQSSIPTNIKIDINKNLLKFEAFLGRKFKQEELYDTVHFISKK